MTDSSGHRGRATTPFHCPFCGEQDLRPDEADAQAWICRGCARVFTVAFLRVDRTLVPGHVAVSQGGAR